MSFWCYKSIKAWLTYCVGIKFCFKKDDKPESAQVFSVFTGTDKNWLVSRNALYFTDFAC